MKSVVPPDFTGAFENFRAEDGSVVSARMENGRIVSQSITTNHRVVTP